MLTVNSILDAVTQRVHDNTATMRGRLLSYLNDAMQQFWLERDWSFLRASASLVISGNEATKPADYGKLLFVSMGTLWSLDKRNQLTTEEAWRSTVNGTESGYPDGWEEDATKIYFRPNADDGTATLVYLKTLPVYAEGDTTLLPDYCRALMVRTLMDAYYEFDADERGLVSIQLHQGELAMVHKFENVRQPQPQRNTRYLRGYK